jgi:membrane carboxypeptidase/penicillin-binding protein
MARVYAAVANGGTLVTPHIGKAIMTPEGKLVRGSTPSRPGASRSARRRSRGCGRLCAASPSTAPGTGRSPGSVPAGQAAGRVQDRNR